MMSKERFNREQFWNKKILIWERARYSVISHEAFDKKKIFSSSVQRRMDLALEILRPVVAGKRILELGCGSGALAPSLLKAGGAHYLGVDFAASAIKKAKELHGGDHCEFSCCALMDVELELADRFDIVFSLGLVDWIDYSELERLASLSGVPHKNVFFLHSFSQKELSAIQLLHQIYVFINYGFKTSGYRPRYHKRHFIKDLFQGKISPHIIEDSQMRFGKFISNIPYS